MKKRHALLLALLVVCVFLINFKFFTDINKKSNLEVVTVGRVIDGDTLVLVDGRTIRLLNINAPEKNQPESLLSKEYLKELNNKTIRVEITGTDKYNRQLARIYSRDEYVNMELVKRGFSSKFLVDKNELKNFADAENYAITNSLGIWKKSDYYGCLIVNINKYKEYVIIFDKCGDINMRGWKIKDESRKTYIFNLTLKKGIELHSEPGKDNQTDMYMGFKDNVWNDDRDSLYIFDDKGRLAAYEAYGY